MTYLGLDVVLKSVYGMSAVAGPARQEPGDRARSGSLLIERVKHSPKQLRLETARGVERKASQSMGRAIGMQHAVARLENEAEGRS